MDVSRNEARVAIMKDIIERLTVRNHPMKSGTYFCLWGSTPEKGEQLQPKIDQIEKRCETCLLGSMFLSYIRLFNEIGFTHAVMGRNKVTEPLLKYFDPYELVIFEYLFEMCGTVPEIEPTAADKDLCHQLIRINRQKRAQLLAEYIVAHDGAFDLADFVATVPVEKDSE